MKIYRIGKMRGGIGMFTPTSDNEGKILTKKRFEFLVKFSKGTEGQDVDMTIPIVEGEGRDKKTVFEFQIGHSNSENLKKALEFFDTDEFPKQEDLFPGQ